MAATVSVYIPTPYRCLTAGQGRVAVQGETIAAVIAALERAYPGMRDRICEGNRVRHHVNVFVNGQEMRALHDEQTALHDGDDVAFVPALMGGAQSRANRFGQIRPGERSAAE